MSLTGLLFVGFYLAGIAAAFLRGPIWGLWTYMAVFYLHPPSRWWGVGLPPMRWALFAALVTLIALIFQLARERNNPSPDARATFYSHGFAIFWTLFVAWIWFQAPWVIGPEHMAGVILFTKYLLMIYLFYSIVRTPKQIKDTLMVHIYGCVYLGWLAFNAGGGGRLEGVGGPGIDDSNSMSMQLGTAVIVGAALMLSEKRWSRLGYLMLLMPLILNGMLQGNSRGAFVGLVFGGAVLWWMKPGVVRGRFHLFAAAAIVGFVALAPVTFWERISTLGAVTNEEQEFDNSASSRLVIMDAQFKMFVDYPLGAGHKGTAELSPQYMDDSMLTISHNNPGSGRARASHNTYLSVMVDHGIFGVVLMFCILFWVWMTVRRGRKRFKKYPEYTLLLTGVSGALAVVGMAGMFAPYLKAEIMYWLIALLMSIVAMNPAKFAEPEGKVSKPKPENHAKRRTQGHVALQRSINGR
ncbi:MAG: O-antigen ligase family protein [Pseudomonadota bacterium]